MYRRNSTFWEWSLQEWVEILCPTAALFSAKWGRKQRYRTTLMDIAYLLGGIAELPLAGVGYDATSAANCYFEAWRVAGQCQKILDTLVGSKQLGYQAGKVACAKIRQYLSTLFLFQRSPSLEDITEELLARAVEGRLDMQWARTKVTIALQRLNLLPVSREQAKRPPGNWIAMGWPQSGMHGAWPGMNRQLTSRPMCVLATRLASLPSVAGCTSGHLKSTPLNNGRKIWLCVSEWMFAPGPMDSTVVNWESISLHNSNDFGKPIASRTMAII